MPLGDNLVVNLSEIPGNILVLTCNVASYPKTNEEAFSTRAMLGNLFQGTKGAVLGLTLDGKNLTLRRIIDYHVEYKEFKELLEDFINVVDFWHTEAEAKVGIRPCVLAVFEYKKNWQLKWRGIGVWLRVIAVFEYKKNW